MIVICRAWYVICRMSESDCEWMRVNECKECWVSVQVGGASSHPLSQRTRARLEDDVLRRLSQRHHHHSRLGECHQGWEGDQAKVGETVAWPCRRKSKRNLREAVLFCLFVCCCSWRVCSAMVREAYSRASSWILRIHDWSWGILR